MYSIADIYRDSVSILNTSNNLTVYRLYIGRGSVLEDKFRIVPDHISRLK